MTSPYILPDGYVEIAFSGGRTSAYMLQKIVEDNGGLPDRCRVVFANTGREWPATLDFVAECGDRFGVPIDWVEYRPASPWFEAVGHNSASRDGEPFAAMNRKEKYLPNNMFRICTKNLKVVPARAFLRSLGWKAWSSAIGIRADEAHRQAATYKERSLVWRPLIDAGISKADIDRHWASMPFGLRLPTIKGKTPLGNCDGCFLKSEAYLAAFARDYPDRARWWEDQEAAAQKTAKGDAARFAIKWSRADLRRSVERQMTLNLSDEDLYCQVDGGECL